MSANEPTTADPSEFERTDTTFSLDAAELAMASLRRPADGPPIVFLHGFGGSKEDYADALNHPRLAAHELLLVDAPGFGASTVDPISVLSIPFLVEATVALCDELGVGRFHLVGHSMGGLTALLLASHHPDRVLSFTNIEGNLAPEDCFLSRQILEYPEASAADFFEAFQRRNEQLPDYSARRYALGLPMTVRPAAVRPVFGSMVELSDGTPLLEMMTDLPMPRSFVYGDQNRHLSYLPQLPERGIARIEIPFSGHFPMYSNPIALWAAIADTVERADDTTDP